MSATPFHDLSDQLHAIADQVATLGDAVHTGSYTVPVAEEPPEPPANGGETGTGTSISTSEELPAE